MTYAENIKIVELNVTEICNRRCWFCPRHDPEVYPNRFDQYMTPNTYYDILRSLESTNFNGIISIAGFGEPLYAKHLLEGIKILSKKYPIKIITNGDRLNLELINKFEKLNVQEFKVDLYDGPHQYEFMMEMFKHSQYTIVDTFSESTNLDKKEVILNKVYAKTIESLNYYNRAGSAEIQGHKGNTLDRPCYVPFYKIKIDWNGQYLLCMSDWHREADISKDKTYNVKDMNVEEYLQSDRFKDFVKSMTSTKRNDLTPCNKCDINGMECGELWSHA